MSDGEKHIHHFDLICHSFLKPFLKGTNLQSDSERGVNSNLITILRFCFNFLKIIIYNFLLRGIPFGSSRDKQTEQTTIFLPKINKAFLSPILQKSERKV